MTLGHDIDAIWRRLAGSSGSTGKRFDPASLQGLPSPAVRWLRRVVPAGSPVDGALRIAMTGRIRLGGRWLPFVAEQILRPGVGFVWRPTVGRGPIRVTGADSLLNGEARMEFRLWGVVPVARATGDDTRRSAAGRLVAETLAWAPRAATPQAGGRWRSVDDVTAVVSLDAVGETVDAEVRIDSDGRLRSMVLSRWNDSTDPPGFSPFGGTIDAEIGGPDGTLVAGAGAVGWGFGTDTWPDGEFFRYEVTALRSLEN